MIVAGDNDSEPRAQELLAAQLLEFGPPAGGCRDAVEVHTAAAVVAALAGKPAPPPGSDIVQLIRRATA